MPVFLFAARWVNWLNPPNPPTCCRLGKPVDLPKLLEKWWRIQRSPLDHPRTVLVFSLTVLWHRIRLQFEPLSVLCFSCMTWLCSEVFYEFSGERLATTNLMNKTTGLGLSEDLIVSVVELVHNCSVSYHIYIYMLVSMLHAQGNLHGHSKASSQYKNRMGIS